MTKSFNAKASSLYSYVAQVSNNKKVFLYIHGASNKYSDSVSKISTSMNRSTLFDSKRVEKLAKDIKKHEQNTNDFSKYSSIVKKEARQDLVKERFNSHAKQFNAIKKNLIRLLKANGIHFIKTGSLPTSASITLAIPIIRMILK